MPVLQQLPGGPVLESDFADRLPAFSPKLFNVPLNLRDRACFGLLPKPKIDVGKFPFHGSRLFSSIASDKLADLGETRPDKTGPAGDAPTDLTILDRALTFAMEGLQAADVQLQRARQEPSSEPGGAFQWWIDLQFFIVALRRLRRAAELATEVPGQRKAMEAAIAAFDKDAPDLLLLRNVGEHIDEYALGAGYASSVRWRQLQVGGWDGKTLQWLDIDLDAEKAMEAARRLVGELEWARVREQKAAQSDTP